MVRDDLRTLSFTDERTSSFTEFYLVRQQSLKFLVNKRYNVSLHSCQRSITGVPLTRIFALLSMHCVKTDDYLVKKYFLITCR